MHMFTIHHPPQSVYYAYVYYTPSSSLRSSHSPHPSHLDAKSASKHDPQKMLWRFFPQVKMIFSSSQDDVQLHINDTNLNQSVNLIKIPNKSQFLSIKSVCKVFCSNALLLIFRKRFSRFFLHITILSSQNWATDPVLDCLLLIRKVCRGWAGWGYWLNIVQDIDSILLRMMRILMILMFLRILKIFRLLKILRLLRILKTMTFSHLKANNMNGHLVNECK